MSKLDKFVSWWLVATVLMLALVSTPVFAGLYLTGTVVASVEMVQSFSPETLLTIIFNGVMFVVLTGISLYLYNSCRVGELVCDIVNLRCCTKLAVALFAVCVPLLTGCASAPSQEDRVRLQQKEKELAVLEQKTAELREMVKQAELRNAQTKQVGELISEVKDETLLLSAGVWGGKFGGDDVAKAVQHLKLLQQATEKLSELNDKLMSKQLLDEQDLKQLEELRSELETMKIG